MVKATGIVRHIDNLGRLVLPKELRKVLNINVHDPLEIFTDGETIILREYRPGCIICDSLDDVVDFKGKKICRKCIESFKE